MKKERKNKERNKKERIMSVCPSMAFRLKPPRPTSWPPQEKVFIWPAPFFQYNKQLLRQKTGGACFYMPQDGHWLASFEVIPPPKKSVFPRPKNDIPH